MKFVFYHYEDGREPQKFAVLKQNPDGTVDIGPEGGKPVVTSCVIVKHPQPGYATATDEPAPAREPAPAKTAAEKKADSGK